MMKPRTTTTNDAVMSLVILTMPIDVVMTEPPPNASSAALPMLFDCTVGNNNAVAIIVAIAKIHAYHFWPMAFSM